MGLTKAGMGTKVQLDNYFPGHHSMRDLGRDSNGGSWPGYYGENNFPNGHYYYGFSPRTVADSFPGYDREVMKQKMLEHEAIFKNQVYELHRVYRVQRELMDEVRRNGLCKQGTPYETSSSSSPLPPQLQLDAQKWNALSFPSANHASGGQPAIRPNVIQSSANALNVESNIQAGPIPFQGCSSPKGSEVSDSRPTKYRRKMFDLELPAANYIDTDEVEQCRDGKASGIDNHLPVERTCRIAPASGVKVFPNHFERVECNGDAPESSLKKSSVLADLNEPVQIEETTGATSVDFLSCATCDEFQHRGHSSTFLGAPKDAVQNQRHGNMNGTSISLHFGDKGDKPGWFSYVIDAEKNKGNVRSMNLGLQPEKSHAPSRPVQLLLDQARKPAGSLPNDHMRGDLWKPKTSSGLETSDGSYFLPHVPSTPSFIHSSDVGNSWEHSVSSWGRPGSCITQRSPSVQANPFLASASFSRSCQSSNTPSNEFFGSMWHLNGNDRLNSGFGTELPLRNGFYHGCSSSGFKEPALRFPSIGPDHVGNSNNDKSALGSSNFIKTETGTNVNTMKDFNLNVADHPNGFSDEWITQHGAKITDREQKLDEPLAALPWLRSNGASLNEPLTSRKCSNSLESALFRSPIETGKGFDSQRSIGPILCDSYAKVNGHVSSISKKIMGVPILGKPSMLKNEASSAVNISSGPLLSRDEEIQRRGKKRVLGLDINAPCDPIDLETSDSADDDATAGVQKKMDGRTPIIGNHFDLNSCIFEDEELLPRTSLANGSATISLKVGTGIDLEAPVVVENEDDNSVIEASASVQQPKVPSEPFKERADRLVADLAQSAAEAIVAMSSNVQQKPAVVDVTPIQVEAPSGDPLSWFVDIACSSPGDFERQLESALGEKIGGDDCLSAGLDYFESMTLKLTECTAEEYMPGPFLPELPNMEDTRISAVGTRSRRGQGRRGRQRRDFQRDILPGLASLSRHEVTEDLQKFGGLMRATGHAWQSGSRRNATRGGCGRGRRRASAAAASQPPERTTWAPLKQQLNTEVALGWGKTTRRPRRQRCPAGNLTTVTLT